MLEHLFEILVGMLIYFGIRFIYSVIYTFFKVARDSVKEDEENGLFDSDNGKGWRS